MGAGLHLALAILAEVIATSALKASAGFTRPLPGAVAVLGYAVAFWFLAQALRSIPMGIAYAIWSAVGIVLISAVGWVWHRQALDLPAILGLGLIIAGVAVIQIFSRAAAG